MIFRSLIDKTTSKHQFLVGLDEAGCGSWAGPLIVVGCTMALSQNTHKIKKLHIKDSKQLTSQNRNCVYKKVIKFFSPWSAVYIYPNFIDKFGMHKAKNFAFNLVYRTIKKSLKSTDTLYISDYFGASSFKNVKNMDYFITSKADEMFICVSAASIIAKVVRDNYMNYLSHFYPLYKWDSNFGYGTKYHLYSIKKHGLTEFHRKSFIIKKLNTQF